MNTNPTQFDAGTPAEVQAILERYRQTGQRLRLFYGDAKTGQDWADEWLTVGRIGRSTGSKPIMILLANRTSDGGPAILTGSIVKLVDIHSRRVLYQHPAYHPPVRTLGPLADGMPAEYQASVYDEQGTNVANFRSRLAARRYIDFLAGRRHALGGRISEREA